MNNEWAGPTEIAEIIFEVAESAEGGYEARALGHSIFTQGDDWNDLKEMARDAVLCHFDEGAHGDSGPVGILQKAPLIIGLHMTRKN